MRHTIPKRERLFRRMQQLAQNGMIAGQKFRLVCQGDVNHAHLTANDTFPVPDRSR